MLDAQDIDHEGQEGSPGQADQYGEEEEEGELEHYEDQPSPEQYNGGISNALADQRVSRKRAQEDVKLLANRIALLKLEEKKVSVLETAGYVVCPSLNECFVFFLLSLL